MVRAYTCRRPVVGERVRTRNFAFHGDKVRYNAKMGRVVRPAGEVSGEQMYIVQLDSGEEIRAGESQLDRVVE